MKYIKTKDNILDIKYTVRTRDEKKLLNYNGEWVDILKQSDTIEELCDVFIKKSKEVGNDYFQIGTDAFIVFDKKYEYYKKWFEHYDYYGAIWTDKGLIYVAKMNEKGELELL